MGNSFCLILPYSSNRVTGLPILPELDNIKINVVAGRAGGLTVAPEVRGVTQDTVDAMAPGAAIYDLHGDNDTVVDISATYFLQETMENFNIPMELVVAEGEGHSLFEYQFLENPDILDYMFTFIADNLSNDDDDDDDIQTPIATPSIIPTPTDDDVV